MKEFEHIVTIGYTILLSLIALIIILRYWYYQKSKYTRISIRQEIKPYRYIRFISILAIALFITGLINYLFILQKGNLFASYWAKASVVILLSILLLSEIFYNVKLQPKKINRIFNLIFTLLFFVIGFMLTRLYFKSLQYPDIDNSVVIDLPFKGNWIASGAGGTSLTNHHDRISSQKYAIDIIKFGDEGKLFKNEGVSNEDSYTFGAEVISPVNGKVVHVSDGLPDKKILDKDKLAGNHIIIQFGDTVFVALAHLKLNSIKVKVGDLVKSGEVLAQVGNSGNTDFPHLHIHVQNSEVYDIETTKSYPVRFSKFKRMRYLFWKPQHNQFLLSNDIISSE